MSLTPEQKPRLEEKKEEQSQISRIQAESGRIQGMEPKLVSHEVIKTS